MRETLVRGCLYIRGAWQWRGDPRGPDRDIARHAAAGMLGMESELLSAEDIRDAWGEIINIVGGNISRFLPEPCQLSTAVRRGDAVVRSACPKGTVDRGSYISSAKNNPFVVGLSEHGEDRHDGWISWRSP